MSRAQFPVTQSPQKTLAGLVFSFAMVGVAQDQSAAGPKSFVTDGAPDPPLYEKINDTLGLSIIV
jgi:hypothetical protein